MRIIKRTSETAITFAVNAAIYSEKVLFKCFYWYGDHYSVSIDLDASRTTYEVTLIPRQSDLTPARIQALEAKIKTDLIDFKTRDIVARETEPIRQILLAKAFASYDGVEEQPPGKISDPVGFEVEDYD